MADQLTDEQMIEFKNVYRTFCKDDIKPLPNNLLGIVLRTLGYYPSEKELTELIAEFDAEEMGWMEQPTFYELMAKKLKQPPVTDEDVRASFRVFDRKSNGFVSAEEIRHILLEIGDRFTDEEMAEFLKHSTPDEDGQIHYDDFVTRMMVKHPLLKR